MAPQKRSPLHPDKYLGKMAMLMVLERMGYGVTGHGSRSTFKDWCRDLTRFENYVSEVALAHASGDKILAAYAGSGVLQEAPQAHGCMGGILQ
jgi:hypothetical protein